MMSSFCPRELTGHAQGWMRAEDQPPHQYFTAQCWASSSCADACQGSLAKAAGRPLVAEVCSLRSGGCESEVRVLAGGPSVGSSLLSLAYVSEVSFMVT